MYLWNFAVNLGKGVANVTLIHDVFGLNTEYTRK